jgi:hypothetical protein
VCALFRFICNGLGGIFEFGLLQESHLKVANLLGVTLNALLKRSKSVGVLICRSEYVLSA